jgi:uncharacterized membrane protein
MLSFAHIHPILVHFPIVFFLTLAASKWRATQEFVILGRGEASTWGSSTAIAEQILRLFRRTGFRITSEMCPE